MIKAINKHGKVSVFSERVWAMMAKDKNGFREFVEGEVELNVPDEIKEFQVKVSDKGGKVPTVMFDLTTPDLNIIPATDQTPSFGDAAAEMDMMREFLASKNVKPHPHLGYDKLKKLYDANK